MLTRKSYLIIPIDPAYAAVTIAEALRLRLDAEGKNAITDPKSGSVYYKHLIDNKDDYTGAVQAQMKEELSPPDYDIWAEAYLKHIESNRSNH